VLRKNKYRNWQTLQRNKMWIGFCSFSLWVGRESLTLCFKQCKKFYFLTSSSQLKLSKLNWKIPFIFYQNTVVFTNNAVETSSCVLSSYKYLHTLHPQQEEQQFVFIVCYPSCPVTNNSFQDSSVYIEQLLCILYNILNFANVSLVCCNKKLPVM
jgi:hypothetical protein